MADNYFGITDTGRVRTNNEDAFIAEKVLQGRYIAACVIDGVGGYEGGEVAAALARQSILEYFSVPSGDITTMMREAFVVANKKITTEKGKNRNYESMACVATLAMVDLTAKTFYYAHIGDTRLYLLRDNSLVKISKDQSFVGYLEDSGRITEEEAMQHPKRNEINNALGFDGQLNAAEVIETGTSPFLPGDLLLLCSDGLSDLVNRAEMEAVLLSDKTLQAKGKELVQRANERGGKDNITVVLVRNHRKAVLQKAIKPAAAAAAPAEVKKNEAPNLKPPEPSAVRPRKNKGPNLLTVLLALLSIGLAVTVAFLLFNKDGKSNAVVNLIGLQKNEMETGLQQALDSNTKTLLVLPDSLVSLPVELNDTLWVRQDSLHIQGNGMRFLKSSGYDGPAFALAATCKYVLVENLTFENFDVGMLVHNKALHLKNVRFIGCRVPVQGLVLFPDNVPVSGTVATFYTTDSLLK